MSIAEECGRLEYHHSRLVERVETLVTSALHHVDTHINDTGEESWELERACEQMKQALQEVGKHAYDRKAG